MFVASGKPDRMVHKCLTDLGLGGDKVRPAPANPFPPSVAPFYQLVPLSTLFYRSQWWC